MVPHTRCGLLGVCERCKVIAVHVDYANRAESADEARFLEEWCCSQGIGFKMRRIDEVVCRTGGCLFVH